MNQNLIFRKGEENMVENYGNENSFRRCKQPRLRSPNLQEIQQYSSNSFSKSSNSLCKYISTRTPLHNSVENIILTHTANNTTISHSNKLSHIDLKVKTQALQSKSELATTIVRTEGELSQQLKFTHNLFSKVVIQLRQIFENHLSQFEKMFNDYSQKITQSYVEFRQLNVAFNFPKYVREQYSELGKKLELYQAKLYNLIRTEEFEQQPKALDHSATRIQKQTSKSIVRHFPKGNFLGRPKASVLRKQSLKSLQFLSSLIDRNYRSHQRSKDIFNN